MIGVNMRAKSILLAFAIGISTNSSFCGEAGLSNPFAAVTSCIGEHKTAIILSAFIGSVVAGLMCLNTEPRIHYNYDNWTEDFKKLFGAYNIFDAESRAVIKHFIKKYFVGAKIKLDDMMIRTKEEDGSVVTIKRKKLTQKPSGFIGLLDAYCLSQMQSVTEFITPAATLYVLLTDPRLAGSTAVNKFLGNKDNNEKKSA